MRKLSKSLLVSTLLTGVSILITLVSGYKWEIICQFLLFLIFSYFVLHKLYYFGVKDEMTEHGYVLFFLLSLFSSPILFILYIYMCLRKNKN